MKKPSKRDNINLFFSAFLILAFIVCAHFFSQFTATLQPTVGALISILVFAVFGLLVFYATRVGDGKPVKRFSLVTLIVLVIPSLYIIVASLAPGLPLYDIFVADTGVSVIVTLAAIALGYGIPYTFLSGYEIAADDEETVEENAEVLEGGVEADLAEDEANEEENAEETIPESEEAVEESAE